METMLLGKKIMPILQNPAPPGGRRRCARKYRVAPLDPGTCQRPAEKSAEMNALDV